VVSQPANTDHLPISANTCYVLVTGALHWQHTTTDNPMFFTLPDGTRYQAKCTKRGQITHGVAVQILFPASDGHYVSHWTLASTHHTWEAASNAGIKAVKTTPHLNDCKLIEAK